MINALSAVVAVILSALIVHVVLLLYTVALASVT